MFDVDGEIRRWRERQERETSLSPRELDELEDHLRARVDLEMELNRCWRLSARLQSRGAIWVNRLRYPGNSRKRVGRAGGVGSLPAGRCTARPGFCRSSMRRFSESSEGTRCWNGPGGVTGALLVFFSNLAMVATALVLWRARLCANRWLWRSVGAVGVSSLVWHAGGLGLRLDPERRPELAGPSRTRGGLLDLDRLVHLRGGRVADACEGRGAGSGESGGRIRQRLQPRGRTARCNRRDSGDHSG